MTLCDNAFCTVEIVECGYIAKAGRKFCCIACAENWRQQNEALTDAAAPFHSPPRRRGSSGLQTEISEGR